ncbi:MAG: PA14 domain-containing protein [Schumannella sp.]
MVYNSYPSVTGVTGATPTGGAVASRAPKMQASVSVPGGNGMVRYEFEKTGGSGTGLGSFSSIAYDTGWVLPGEFPVPSNVLEAGTEYRYRVTVKDGYDGWLGNDTKRSVTNAAWYFTTNSTPAVDQGQSSPADDEVVTSTTPQFSVPYTPDPDDADPVRFKFVVATGPDGRTGAVVTSGWLDAPSTTPGDPVTWTPVEGALLDGGSYTWRVWADDGTDEAEQAWAGHFKVNLRLGTTGPSPFDTAGPASVNLANGNLALNFASPMIPALGGPMGLSFSYNSQADPNGNKGLAAAYYNALNQGQTSTTTFTFDNREPVLAQTEPAVSFTQPDQVAPAVPADYFLGRWTGFVTPPTAGSYTFGVVRNDGARVVVGTTTVVDKWTTTGSTDQTDWGTAYSLPGTPTPIRVDYYDATGNARLGSR